VYQGWLGPIAVRILVASNTVASVWSAKTTVSTTKPAASSGATSGHVPNARCRRTRIRSRGRPATNNAATAISPVGCMPSVNAAVTIANAAGVSRPEMIARSIST